MPVILALHPSPPPFQPNLLVYFFFPVLSLNFPNVLFNPSHLRLQLDLPFFHISAASHSYFDHSNQKNLKDPALIFLLVKFGLDLVLNDDL